MKKIFTFCCLFAAVYANAQSIKTFRMDTWENGYQVMDISNNGKYIGGCSMFMEMFIIDVESGEAHIQNSLDESGGEVRGVSNTGLGVGYNGSNVVTLSAKGEFNILEEPTEEFYGMGEDVSDDGRIIVGAVVNQNYGDEWQKRPCVWIDGVRTMLPEPAAEDLNFNSNGACAKCVSADGSVILGHIIDDMYSEPAVLWVKDGDGYRIDPIYKGLFHPTQYDENLGDYRKYDEPYLIFRWGGISANGKYAVLTISEYLGEEMSEWGFTMINQTENRIGIYNTETRELKIITVDGNHGIDAESSLAPTAIANDGTVVGYTGDGGFRDTRLGFIMKAGEDQPRLLSEVFSEIEEFATYDMNGLNTVTSISADGRYIAGFGFNTTEVDFGEGIMEPVNIAEGFVLDTKPAGSDGISAITEKTTETSEYFTVDGRKLDAPVKGLNIIKASNGETRKVFVK